MSDKPIPGKLIEGVFRRVLAQDLTPELQRKLVESGLDLDQGLKAEYPRETWYRAIEETAKALYPREESAAQLRRLGRHIVESLDSRKIVKGPWLSMAKFLGPKRAMLKAAEHSERFSPVKLELHEKSGKEVEVHVEEDRQLDFLAGLLEGLVGALGGKSPHVRVMSTDGLKSVLSAQWS
jgi:uncharacterized protein (TIGR02265 family)